MLDEIFNVFNVEIEILLSFESNQVLSSISNNRTVMHFYEIQFKMLLVFGLILSQEVEEQVISFLFNL